MPKTITADEFNELPAVRRQQIVDRLVALGVDLSNGAAESKAHVQTITVDEAGGTTSVTIVLSALVDDWPALD